MEYRYLGRSGLKVSELCLGAMTFGRETTEPGSRAMMDLFADAGGNFIDTADVYTAGASEEIVGRWLVDKRREDFVIATKVRFPMGDGPNDTGTGRKHILAGIEDSLRRLQTDYVDLYQLHCWDPGTPLEESISTLDSLVRQGKVRYIGVSNYTGWQLQKAVDLCHQNGWSPLISLQPLYNLLDRSTEWELVSVCENEGLGIVPWSPLRGGWLSGKYRRDMSGPPENTRIEMAAREGWMETWDAYANERTWRILDELYAVASEVEKTPAQVALRWLSQRRGVTAPIVGARHLAHLEDNLGAVGWTLDPERMDRLTSASDPTLPYPYDFMARIGAA